MFGKNRPGRNESQRYSRAENAGYDDRFGSYGMRGPQRRFESDADAYNWDQSGSRGVQGYSDYASFEGANEGPYYGGEEGPFPFGGSSGEYPHSRNSWNADERNYSGNWMRGEHVGKGPKGYRRSDERIREEVCDMLTQHGEIDASEVEVDVRDCVVSLSGTVQNRRVKRMVEDLTENINGVQDVRNDLRVMAQGIAPENSAEFQKNSSRSHAVGSKDRSSAKSTKSAQSSSRRMNS